MVMPFLSCDLRLVAFLFASTALFLISAAFLFASSTVLFASISAFFLISFALLLVSTSILTFVVTFAVAFFYRLGTRFFQLIIWSNLVIDLILSMVLRDVISTAFNM